MLFIFLLSATTTILAKSANGIFFMLLGIIFYYAYKYESLGFLFKLLTIGILVYILTRLLTIVSIEMIQNIASIVFNSERIESLTDRLVQEDLFNIRTLEHPIFGWGGFGRGWPQNTRRLFNVVDSLVIAVSNRYGYFGLISLYSSLLLGPWHVFFQLTKKKLKKHMIHIDEYHIDSYILSLIVVFFLIDSLFNGMINPIYIFCAGALVSFIIDSKELNKIANGVKSANNDE